MELLKKSYGHFMDRASDDDDDDDDSDVVDITVSPKSLDDSLECPYCFDVLESIELLRLHKRAHHEEKRYTCKICKTIFISFIGWQYHYRKHNNDLRYSCDSCKMKFCTFQQMVSHTGNHKFFCSTCDAGFVYSEHLRKHEMKVHRKCLDDIDESKSYHCKKCNITFTSCVRWHGHLKKNKLCRPFICSKCNSGFMTEMHFKSHVAHYIDCRQTMERMKRKKINNNDKIRPVRVVVNRIDRKYSTSSSSTSTSSPGSSTNYICNKCDQSFTKLQARREHWIRNVECRPYGCSHCTARFVTKEDIEKHVRIHMFKCHCARTFLYKSDFEAHCRSHNRTKKLPDTATLEAAAAANKIFVCGYCAETYFTEDELQKHIEFDTQFVYICSQCFEVFRNECTFGHHMMNSHGVKRADISTD